MKNAIAGLAALISGIAGAMPATAADEDRSAILAAADKLFEAINTHDGELWKSVLLPECLQVFFRPGEDGVPALQTMTNADSQARFEHPAGGYRERWTAEPTVLIRENIAVVWGEYDFWVGERFNHCGIDSIDLVKINDQWKITNIMWTTEKENCPTDPANAED